ncbi:MAG: class I SAM-dependent methyltransferase [Prochlorococcus marinus XMU1425]|nr:class I SAM-dependent methyltransferase [Prochlorococcus marinus XMU1425]MCR8534162.1 class I SAM-dependent methyltransferase [Prochlorococcus marinus XMU1426]
MFLCPCCKKKLFFENKKDNILICKNSSCLLNKRKFPIIKNIPLLVPFGMDDCIFKEKYFLNEFLNLGIRRTKLSSKNLKIQNFLKNIILGENQQSRKNFNYLISKLKRNSKVLIIGGGTIGSGSEEFYSFCSTKKIQIDSIDIYFSENITAIADAHYLPFRQNSYNLVIVQAVLEHVINPHRVVDEIYRVLDWDGVVYSETPFMQSVHEGPFDFQRFSHSGHRWLFKKFKEVSSGVHHGAFSSLLFILSYSLSGIFRNKKIGIFLRFLFSKISKLLDNLNNKKSNVDIACGCYFIGKKSMNYNYKNLHTYISDYYEGSQ